MQVAPSGGQICNKCKWCHIVAKFSPSHGVNFWVRCASGNVLIYHICISVPQPFLRSVGWSLARGHTTDSWWGCFYFVINHYLAFCTFTQSLFWGPTYRVNNTNLIPQLDLRHMNQLPTNNSIGIAMDLRSHLNVFIFNFLSISNQTFFFNLQLVSSLSKIFCVFFRLLIFSRDFYISTEWDVMEVPAQRNEKYYPCCEVKVQKNIHAVR